MSSRSTISIYYSSFYITYIVNIRHSKQYLHPLSQAKNLLWWTDNFYDSASIPKFSLICHFPELVWAVNDHLLEGYLQWRNDIGEET